MKVYMKKDWEMIANAVDKGMSIKRVAEIVKQQREIPGTARHEVALWNELSEEKAKELREELIE